MQNKKKGSISAPLFLIFASILAFHLDIPRTYPAGIYFKCPDELGTFQTQPAADIAADGNTLLH